MTTSRRNGHDPAALLTQSEVARRLGVSVRTVRELRFVGELRTVNLGYRTKRVAAGDVDRLVARRTQAS